MKIFAVRNIVELNGDSRLKKKHRYEERITVWRAIDFHSAILKAETEAAIYGKEEVAVLSFFQAYEVVDNIQIKEDGAEIFSLIRESDLDPDAFLDRYFEAEK